VFLLILKNILGLKKLINESKIHSSFNIARKCGGKFNWRKKILFFGREWGNVGVGEALFQKK